MPAGVPAGGRRGLHGRQWHRRLVVGGQCGWIGFSGLPTLLSAAFAARCRRGRRSLGTGLRRGRDLGCGFRREAGAGLRPLMRPTCDLRVGGHRHQRRFVDRRRRNAGRLPGLRGRRDARGDRRRLPCYRSGRRHCWRWRCVRGNWHGGLPSGRRPVGGRRRGLVGERRRGRRVGCRGGLFGLCRFVALVERWPGRRRSVRGQGLFEGDLLRAQRRKGGQGCRTTRAEPYPRRSA